MNTPWDPWGPCVKRCRGEAPKSSGLRIFHDTGPFPMLTKTLQSCFDCSITRLSKRRSVVSGCDNGNPKLLRHTHQNISEG